MSSKPTAAPRWQRLGGRARLPWARRPRVELGLVATALMLVGASALATVLSVAQPDRDWLASPFMLSMTLTGIVLFVVGRPLAGCAPKAVLHDGAVTVRGERIAPPAVHEAWRVLHAGVGERLEVTLRSGRSLSARLTPGEAGAALQALGVADPRLALKVELGVGAGAAYIALGCGPVVMSVVAVIATVLSRALLSSQAAVVCGVAVGYATLAGIILGLARGRELVVASDGFALSRRLGRPIVVAAHEVAHVERDTGRRIVVVTKAGTRHVLGSARELDLVAIFRGVLAGWAARPRVSSARTELARSGRPVSEWRAAIASLAGGDYRIAALPMDEVVTIVCDGSQAADQRLAAALLLRASGDRAPIRLAADEEISPPLRRALEALADSPEEVDDETLESATRERASR